MESNALNIKIKANADPFISFVETFNRFLESGHACSVTGLNFTDYPKDLVRIEYDGFAAEATELSVVFHPSDAFLGFVAACAGDFDFKGVN